jgi:two-component system, LuxR family, response regulator FixJ
MPRDGQRSMIFIVDDDDAVRDSLALLLECDGLPAQGFASARAFLEGGRPGGRDCLIVDLHMSGLNGIELLEELRRRGTRLPAIVITGRPTQAARNRAEAAGALALLEKPYDSKRLLKLVHQALDGKGPAAAASH